MIEVDTYNEFMKCNVIIDVIDGAIHPLVYVFEFDENNIEYATEECFHIENVGRTL